MQKKIIALAVAGLMSGAAFAQSNVTIYGLVDMGYSHRSDNRVAGVKSRSGVDSGMQSGNRLGFRGTEDLGGGLKAGFVLEQGFAVDTGVFGANGATAIGFGRQAFMTLSGAFGTVAAGRQLTPQFNLLASVDPFGAGTVGQANNLYVHTTRLDNLAAYVSPNFSGLNVVVGYTPNASGNELANDAGNTRVWAIAPTYKQGPITAGLNYHNVKTENTAFSTKVWDLGVSYDLGMAKLAFLYGRDTDFNAAKNDRTKYMLGVTVKAGAAGNVLASYNQAKTNQAGDPKGRQVALGYTHDLSKRTNLYAVYADISNKNGAAYTVGDASNAGAGYQSGLNLGVRHRF